MKCEPRCLMFLQNGFQRLKRNSFVLNTYLFFRDLVFSFAYFLSPLYYMFFKFPKLYEVIISFIVFIKNNLPTKSDINLTLNVWLLNILLTITKFKILVVRGSIFIIKNCFERVDSILDKISCIKYKN